MGVAKWCGAGIRAPTPSQARHAGHPDRRAASELRARRPGQGLRDGLERRRRLDLLVGDFAVDTSRPSPADATARAALHELRRTIGKQLETLDATSDGETEDARDDRIARCQQLVRQWAEVDLDLSQSGTNYVGHVFLFLRLPPAARGSKDG